MKTKMGQKWYELKVNSRLPTEVKFMVPALQILLVKRSEITAILISYCHRKSEVLASSDWHQQFF
jgi:hypothetical protein